MLLIYHLLQYHQQTYLFLPLHVWQEKLIDPVRNHVVHQEHYITLIGGCQFYQECNGSFFLLGRYEGWRSN